MGCLQSHPQLLTFDGQYEVGKELGKGSFGTVLLCVHQQSKKQYAVKMIDRQQIRQTEEKAFKREVAVMQLLSGNERIVHLFEFFEEADKYFIVLEYMQGGELFDRIVKKQRYSEREARDTVKILVSAIKHCHDLRVVHRDLKIENLLLTSLHDDASLKIADFGLANIMEGGQLLTTVCGSPEYVAPEVISSQPYGATADMWSIGVITFILLGGYSPFKDSNVRLLFQKIVRGQVDFAPVFWDKVSLEAKDLILGLLTLDVNKRLTADDVLNHAWVRQSDEVLEAISLDTNLQEFKKFNDSKKAAPLTHVNNNHDLLVMFLMLDTPKRESVFNLLDCHPDISEFKDPMGRLPLHLALEFMNPPDVILSILAANPGAARERDSGRRLPLHVALSSKAPDEVVVALVAAYEEGCGAKDSDGTLPFHRLLEKEYPSHVVAAWLASHPSSASLRDSHGHLPLVRAFELNAPAEVVLCLLHAYPSAACEPDNLDRLPLLIAFEKRAAEEVVVALLTIYPGACKVKHEFTGYPLHAALVSGASTQIVLAVLATYVNASRAEDGAGNDPLSLARRHRASDDVIQALATAIEQCEVAQVANSSFSASSLSAMGAALSW